MNLQDVPKATFDKEAEAQAVKYFKSYYDRGVYKNIPAGSAAPGRMIDQIRAMRTLDAMGY